MRKVFLIVALVAFGVLAAQTEKGTFAIGGKTNLGFNSTTVNQNYGSVSLEVSKTTSFNITPNAGYFLIDNLLVGIDFNYSITTTKRPLQYYENFDSAITSGFSSYSYGEGKRTETQLGVLPNIHYFFGKEKLKPYVAAGLGIANVNVKTSSPAYSITNTTDYYETSSTSNGLVWSVGGGCAYFISKFVSLDLGLEYGQYTYNQEGTKSKQEIFGASVGVSVFLK
jgi:outer membrane protein